MLCCLSVCAFQFIGMFEFYWKQNDCFASKSHVSPRNKINATQIAPVHMASGLHLLSVELLSKLKNTEKQWKWSNVFCCCAVFSFDVFVCGPILWHSVVYFGLICRTFFTKFCIRYIDVQIWFDFRLKPIQPKTFLVFNCKKNLKSHQIQID